MGTGRQENVAIGLTGAAYAGTDCGATPHQRRPQLVRVYWADLLPRSQATML